MAKIETINIETQSSFKSTVAKQVFKRTFSPVGFWLFICFWSVSGFWEFLQTCALILSETLALYKSFTYLLTY